MVLSKNYVALTVGLVGALAGPIGCGDAKQNGVQSDDAQPDSGQRDDAQPKDAQSSGGQPTGNASDEAQVVCNDIMPAHAKLTDERLSAELSDEGRAYKIDLAESIKACTTVMYNQTSWCMEVFGAYMKNNVGANGYTEEQAKEALAKVNLHCVGDGEDLMKESVILSVSLIEQHGDVRKVTPQQSESLKEVIRKRDANMSIVVR